MSQMEILEGRGLSKVFRVPGRGKSVRAVDDVSLAIGPGEIVGLVGESGSGKSTVSRMLVGIERPSVGEIRYRNAVVSSKRDWRGLRDDVQYVFQDPYASLAPHLTIRDSVGDALDLRGIGTRRERDHRVAEVLEQVGLRASDAKGYPALFSGGQRQRICLARALIMNQRVIICDEIVSGLDVSVQAQILNLLLGLRETLDVAYLFVSHDLRVVKYLSDRVIVMRAGAVVEEGATEQVFQAPEHEYTRMLLDAIPQFDGLVDSEASI